MRTAFCLLVALSSVRGQDAAFQKFFAADSPAAAARVADNIAKTNITFDEALRRLKAGRTYTTQKTGVIQLKNRTSDGIEHYYSVNIPPGYDPAKRYQVRFQLHGGIGGRSDNKPRGNGEIGSLAGAEQIYVLPYSWDQAPWWGDDQVLNLSAIVDTLKRTYNVDENRVVVSGVSDGATGAYFIAMRETTPYASFLPLNGFIAVLANEEIDDGRNFPNNLRNKPMFLVNGGKDRLYPTSIVEPYTKHLMNHGVDITYDPQPEGEHNTRWWPEVRDVFEKFAADHPRDPHPDKLTWEAADAAHNRAHWLVIDEFGPARGEPKEMADLNMIQDLGQLFNRSKQFGRVDLLRTGNTVRAETSGVTSFTLLLSPDKFDFTQPIQVIANDREVFNGRMERSVKTLLKWAAKDNDRTMLYAAELKIKLPK
jgi:predicted esterase